MEMKTMDNLERMTKKSTSVMLTITAVSALAFTGCGRSYNECENGKDKDGKNCEVHYVHGSGYHYFPRSYTGPYSVESTHIGPTAIPSGAGYRVGPRTVIPSTTRGGFGSIGRGFGASS
jgi:hypothetical protein